MPDLHEALRQRPGQDRYAGTELLLRGEDDLARYNAWVVDMFVRHAGADARRVLDFGAGVGSLSRLFEARTGVRPEAVEIDPRQRAVCMARGFVTHASLDECTGRYDLVFSSNVLEHIDDDRAVLRALHERLAPGGRIVVYVPAFMLIWTSLDDHVGHYRRYTRAQIERRLAEAGFEAVNSHYCDSVGFALAWLYKHWGRRRAEPSPRSLRFFDRWLLPLSRCLDLAARRFVGKNVLAVATRAAPAPTQSAAA